jgi:uncharacterized protein
MLELRPTCEHCNKALPSASREAMMCSYECTFCADCAMGLLGNVCPNCGGGFERRPVRPATNWRRNNYLGADPATTRVTHRPVDLKAHSVFAAQFSDLPPQER